MVVLVKRKIMTLECCWPRGDDSTDNVIATSAIQVKRETFVARHSLSLSAQCPSALYCLLSHKSIKCSLKKHWIRRSTWVKETNVHCGFKHENKQGLSIYPDLSTSNRTLQRLVLHTVCPHTFNASCISMSFQFILVYNTEPSQHAHVGPITVSMVTPPVFALWASNGFWVGFRWGPTGWDPIRANIWGLSRIRMDLKWGPFSQPT